MMTTSKWFLLGLCVLQLSHSVQSRFVVEQGGIKVKFPASARSKYPKGFDTSLANFGKRMVARWSVFSKAAYSDGKRSCLTPSASLLTHDARQF